MTSFDVIVVGAGFAGLYALHRFRGLGFKTVVLDKAGGVGGTWYWNAYPGCRCDVESLEYSYTFSPELQAEWQWSERYATQPEILKYLNHVADRFDLRRDIRLSTAVNTASFVDGKWVVTAATATKDGEGNKSGEPTTEQLTCKYLIMATGAMSQPVTPQLKGLNTFAGEVYYPNTTPNPTLDFKGKRVAVIGTGSTGVQMIPILADLAKELYVVQRTAMYVAPAHNRVAGEREAKMREKYDTIRAIQKAHPFAGFTGLESGFIGKQTPMMEDSEEERLRTLDHNWNTVGGIMMGLTYADIATNPEANEFVQEFFRKKIREAVQDKNVAELLLPQHILASRRVCVGTNYYETFNKPNVHLVTATKDAPIQTVDATGLTLADGTHIDVDVLVLATGFDQLIGALNRIDIRGVDKTTTLKSAFDTAPISLWGMLKPGFPNLFTINGPGSPSVLTAMVYPIEFNVDFALRIIQHMEKQGLGQVEADATAEQEWFGLTQFLAHQATLLGRGSATSPYAGANVEGKTKAWLPFLGHTLYAERLNAAADSGFTGLHFAPVVPAA